jgi:hypothetical protein
MKRKSKSSVDLLQNDRLYSDKPFQAHDGTVINSRRKHREYMKRHNVTTADDFTQHWKQAAEQRADFYTSDRAGAGERVEAIKHAIEEQRRGRR